MQTAQGMPSPSVRLSVCHLQLLIPYSENLRDKIFVPAAKILIHETIFTLLIMAIGSESVKIELRKLS